LPQSASVCMRAVDPRSVETNAGSTNGTQPYSTPTSVSSPAAETSGGGSRSAATNAVSSHSHHLFGVCV